KLCEKHLNEIIKSAHAWTEPSEKFDRKKNTRLGAAIKAAVVACIPLNYIERAITLAQQGITSLKFPVYNTDWTSAAYITVSRQNSNNSLSVTNACMDAVENGGTWPLVWRIEKAKAAEEGREPKPCKTVNAQDIWEQVAYAAWASADPGLQYDTTI